ncbi:MAG TPA: zinc ribbon domain-containing protein [Clostridia bacterium]|nr:zinc ribbon domain-containing protein [Clostridia bacterium]
MKHCINCQAELNDDAKFCAKCGKQQEPDTQETIASPVTPPSMAQPDVGQAPYPQPPPAQAPHPGAGPYPPQQQQGAPGAPPPPYPYPSEPKPPSALALEGKRYFAWLGKGIFGTTEPMHFLFAAIVPFLISLFYTLAASKMMNWHAGGFFLMWFFNMIIIVAMPAAAWFGKRYLLKEDISAQDAFAQYSSYLNIVLPITLLIMILGFAISLGGFIHLLSILHLVPVLLLVASILTCISGSNAGMKKLWLVSLVLIAVYIILSLISSSILVAGGQWGAMRGFR